MENSKSIDVLNNLLEINNDRIEGYETALEETTDSSLKTLFTGFINTSRRCKDELTREVVRLGGEPVEGTRISGKFFRVWMDVKAALTGNDKKFILNSCEEGEDVAINNYEHALEEHLADLSLEQQEMVRSQYFSLKSEHDSVKVMRDTTT
ncbi:MAG: PA2169 family four-helix-bundle protein [Bacteroidota bacterium]